MSGGFPHSEIQGSKPITGSPWLIAGYHVLHRLLLPRHPPNALLALDLIQKKTDLLPRPQKLVTTDALILNQKHTFPLDPWKGSNLVSVLDLDNSVRFSRHTHGQVRKHLFHTLAIGSKTSSTKLRCLHTRKHQTVLMSL